MIKPEHRKMPKAKIMLVEDEWITALNLKRTLERLGYAVIHVSRGESALPMIAMEHPDLILMDICLAGKLDGIQTAEVVQEHYSIPIIFQTAFLQKLPTSKRNEPFGHLVKPLSFSELHATIERTLFQSQLKLMNQEESDSAQTDDESP